MRRAAPALLLLAITIAFYWKLTLSRQYTMLDSPDMAYMTLPWYQFQARAFHRGAFPLWDPYQWSGQTVVGQLQLGTAFPLNWPLFLAPLRHGRINIDWFHWHYVLLHWLAALFMYFYCRDLGLTGFGATLAACAFSFAGFVGETTWPQVMNGAIWLPLIFLFYHRAAEAAGRRRTAAAAGCGAAIGMALLAGHHQAPMLAILTLTAVFLFHLWTRPARLEQLRAFGIIAAFAALLGAAVLIPGWEYGTRAYRWVNLPEPVRFDQTLPYITQRDLALKPVELLGLVAPIQQGTAHPFVGLIPVALALYAVAACWRKRAVRLHACIALGGLAYTLGSYSVFQGVVYAVMPVLNKGRSPNYAVLIFQFGLLVLAAHGADALFLPIREQRRFVRGLLIAAAVLGGGPLLLMTGSPPAPNRIPSPIIAAAVALLAAGIAYAAAARRLSRRVAQVAITVLLLVELNQATATVLLPLHRPGNQLDRLAQHRPAVDFLRAQPGPFRFHADDQEIPHNAGDWEGLEATEGYVATVAAATYDFIGLDWVRSKLLLNQLYWVGREKQRPEQVEVFAEPSGLKVFRNPDAFPRVWMVHAYRVVSSRPEAGDLLKTESFDAHRETFFFAQAARPPALEACDSTAELIARDLHRVAARVRSSCTSMVVFSEPVFPGWKARVDGSPAAIYAAYGALRGVVVPPGEHRVETAYRPMSVYAGAIFSALGLIGVFVLAARRR